MRQILALCTVIFRVACWNLSNGVSSVEACSCNVGAAQIVVIVAYLMVKEGVSLLDAVRHVMARRGTVLTNRSFRKQLLDLAMSQGLRLGVGEPQYDDA